MWKQIKDFPMYSVSDEGQVKNNKTQRILSAAYNQDGYAIVQLWKDKKPSMKRIHRLVLETFCPIENSELFEVNHLDRNIKNNFLQNLEWCSSSQNILHRDKEDNPNKKTKKVQVEFLDGTIKVFNSLTDCAEYFNVTKSTIKDYMKTKCSPRRKIQANFTYL